VGIPRPLQSLATPTLPTSEADGGAPHPFGCRETISPIGFGAAVLVPPTGNGVLNQIPAGDGRESSREQAVPDDGAPLHRIVSRGPGDHIPLLTLRGLGGRAASLTHKKKKKKKKKKVERSGGEPFDDGRSPASPPDKGLAGVTAKAVNQPRLQPMPDLHELASAARASEPQLSDRGVAILKELTRDTLHSTGSGTRRDAILWALTDGTFD